MDPPRPTVEVRGLTIEDDMGSEVIAHNLTRPGPVAANSILQTEMILHWPGQSSGIKIPRGFPGSSEARFLFESVLKNDKALLWRSFSNYISN